jgi:hypothetical protein
MIGRRACHKNSSFDRIKMLGSFRNVGKKKCPHPASGAPSPAFNEK